jgi:phosphate transport system substrate-binding protein
MDRRDHLPDTPRFISRFLTGVFVFVWILMAASFPNPGHAAGKSERLRVVGSTTVLPVVSRAVEKFKETRSGLATITVNPGGSGVGINSVGTGRADIGMISREISPQERERFRKAGLQVQVIGRDGVACVVSSEVYSSGVRVLSKEQIRDIYLGKIQDWSEVGGPERPIVVVDKERHRGTRHVFMKYILGDGTARAPAARLVTGSNNEEQAKIAQSDAAIGMLSSAWLNNEVAGVSLLENGEVIEPTVENIRSGRFPIHRKLSLVTRGEPQGLAKEFIDFIVGAEGQRIVEASGYAPIIPASGPNKN